MNLRGVTDSADILKDLEVHSFSIVNLGSNDAQSILSFVPRVLDNWVEQTYDDTLEVGRQLPRQGKEFIAVKTGLPVRSLIPTSTLSFCQEVIVSPSFYSLNLTLKIRCLIRRIVLREAFSVQLLAK
jgi:hypothetical protein